MHRPSQIQDEKALFESVLKSRTSLFESKVLAPHDAVADFGKFEYTKNTKTAHPQWVLTSGKPASDHPEIVTMADPEFDQIEAKWAIQAQLQGYWKLPTKSAFDDKAKERAKWSDKDEKEMARLKNLAMRSPMGQLQVIQNKMANLKKKYESFSPANIIAEMKREEAEKLVLTEASIITEAQLRDKAYWKYKMTELPYELRSGKLKTKDSIVAFAKRYVDCDLVVDAKSTMDKLEGELRKFMADSMREAPDSTNYETMLVSNTQDYVKVIHSMIEGPRKRKIAVEAFATLRAHVRAPGSHSAPKADQIKVLGILFGKAVVAKTLDHAAKNESTSIKGKSLTEEDKKEGEGSRGGNVIGHTKSGKPIYGNAGSKHHKDFSSDDHQDAARAHNHQQSKKSEEYHAQHNGDGTYSAKHAKNKKRLRKEIEHHALHKEVHQARSGKKEHSPDQKDFDRMDRENDPDKRSKASVAHSRKHLKVVKNESFETVRVFTEGGPGSGGGSTKPIKLDMSPFVSVGTRKGIINNMPYTEGDVEMSKISHVGQANYVPKKMKNFIKNQDLISKKPVSVLYVPSTDSYHMMDGHHRYLAAKHLGMDKVPAKIWTKHELPEIDASAEPEADMALATLDMPRDEPEVIAPHAEAEEPAGSDPQEVPTTEGEAPAASTPQEVPSTSEEPKCGCAAEGKVCECKMEGAEFVDIPPVQPQSDDLSKSDDAFMIELDKLQKDMSARFASFRNFSRS